MKKWMAIAAIYCSLGIFVARADLTMSLSASVQNSARGVELVFSGTLTNTSATDKLFLNDIAPTLGGASASNLSFKPNSFFSNVPGVLLPNESYSDSELFRVALSGAAPSGDYGGAVTIRGGADIFANDNLASSFFIILSPDVNIVANDANASEVGPDPGVFTISRTGGTSIDLPVFFTISGTAMNGSAYNAITPVATILAGSDSTTVTITPIPNNVAEGDRSANLSLTSTYTYNLGLSVTDTVTIHDKPADAWRFAEFGTNANDPAAADGNDWDGDGIRNLLEFALDLDPKTSDTIALPAAVISDDYLTISFVPNSDATDVSFIVEASTDLTNWNTSDVEVVPVQNPNPPGLQTFRYKFAVSLTSKAFLRLRVVRTDL
ncbi:MAG: hypothetical protein ACXWGY_06080 [Chthoniobacterales bacterium]